MLTGSGAAGVASAEQLFAVLRPWSEGATFANFVDTDDPVRIARSYDNPTRDRMRLISEKCDPKRLFAVAGELRT